MYRSNKVTIYDGAKFQGSQKELDEGEYNIYALGIGNNKLSSLTVPAGMKVTLYEYEDFRGRSKTFTSNVAELKNIEVEGKSFNNQGKRISNAIDKRIKMHHHVGIRVSASQTLLTVRA